MPSSPRTTPARSRATSTSAVLSRVAADGTSRVVFAVLALIAFGIYATVLPSEEAGGQLSLTNWTYLTGPLLAFSIILAVGLSTVLTLQLYAMRQALAARRAAGGRAALGGAGFLASLAPALCCSPVLPAVLAVFGVGASGATATMKTIAPYLLHMLTATLFLFVALGWWTARRIARQTRSTPLADSDCCGPNESLDR